MGFIEDISTATDIIRSADAVTLVSHIDADGITARQLLLRQSPVSASL